MKRIVTLVAVLLAATALGCKDSTPPKTDSRVESASEAARNDDRAIAVRLAQQKAATDDAYQRQRARESRQQYVDLLRAAIKRWEDGLSAAALTPRFEIGSQIIKLQAIRTEVGVIDVDDCSGPARTTLQSSMAVSFEALAIFQKETGESGDAATQKVTQAAELLRQAKTQTDACLNK